MYKLLQLCFVFFFLQSDWCIPSYSGILCNQAYNMQDSSALPFSPLIIKPFQTHFFLTTDCLRPTRGSTQCLYLIVCPLCRNFSRTTASLQSNHWLPSATFKVTLRTSERKTGDPDPDQWPGETLTLNSISSFIYTQANLLCWLLCMSGSHQPEWEVTVCSPCTLMHFHLLTEMLLFVSPYMTQYDIRYVSLLFKLQLCLWNEDLVRKCAHCFNIGFKIQSLMLTRRKCNNGHKEKRP